MPNKCAVGCSFCLERLKESISAPSPTQNKAFGFLDLNTKLRIALVQSKRVVKGHNCNMDKADVRFDGWCAKFLDIFTTNLEVG